LVSKDAPKETLDFMKVWLGKETQTKLAAEGLSIPMVKGTAEAIQNPFYKALAAEVDHSRWICVAMDQLLGRETGRIFNDEAAAVAAGAHSPEEAAQVIEHSWSKSRISRHRYLKYRAKSCAKIIRKATKQIWPGLKSKFILQSHGTLCRGPEGHLQ
jgi:hypothetical protein